MLLNVLYVAVLILFSPFLAWRAFRHGKYRRGWWEKLTGRIHLPDTPGRRVWFHAVSVGEVNLLAGLCQEMRNQFPELDFVVSSTTSTGYELAQARFGAERVVYCPFDFTWAIRAALGRIRPQMLVLAELEVWPNLIRLTERAGVPIAVVNGRLSERSARGYSRLGAIVRPTFRRISLVAAQDPLYADRFVTLGVPAHRVHVTGSCKFDNAPLTRDTKEIVEFSRLVGRLERHYVLMAGSTQQGEEGVVLDVFQRLREAHKQLRLIVVPRHAERFDEVAALIERAGLSCWRRSLAHQPASDWPAERVVLIDSIGELRSWWGLADCAFVGGSWGNRGGQNMLEPAGYGAAVCFGSNTKNFRDIVHSLLERQAAEVVVDGDALAAFVEHMLLTPDEANAMGARARAVVQHHQGATQKTVDLLRQLADLSNR